jgi:exodeoxyribonuclease V alpha subunit
MEICGLIEEIIYRNEINGYTVLEIRDEANEEMVTAVGRMLQVAEGERVRLSGEWTVHRDYGRQLKVEKLEALAPAGLAGLERYLGSGLIKGIGPATAKKLVEHFGEDVLEVLEYAPQRLTEISGIGMSKAERMAASFAEQKEIRDVMLFLQQYNVTTAQAVRIYRTYKGKTIQNVRENPYRLAEDVHGIGFKTADRIAQSMGIEKASPYRIAAGIRYALGQASGLGHTCLPQDALAEQAAGLMEIEPGDIGLTLGQMILEQRLIADNREDGAYVYLPSFYFAEMAIAKKLRALVAVKPGMAGDLTRYVASVQAERGIALASQQEKAVRMALENGVFIITGGPGTGKTTIINCIIDLMAGEGLRVELAAPTGRAAKRMAETTGREARTIHRMLEYTYGEGDGYTFGRDEDNPVEADAVIIDEMSMVDILLMHHMLKAVSPGTRLILVGDADQLPPVGPGNVLADIIGCGWVPVVRLTEIFRQAQESSIVMNAHRINAGEAPVSNEEGGDFYLMRQEKPGSIVETVLGLVTQRLPEYKGYDPICDIQVLCPMRKTEMGVYAFNQKLQRALNPPAPDKKEYSIGDSVFRQGDKVMQTRNNYKLSWKRYDIAGAELERGEGVFNGDMGFIRAIDDEEQTVEVVYDGDRHVPYDFSQTDELELAYAVSVHKSQGSEFPVVILPLAWGPPMLMTRNLLYTAITRAKELAVLVGWERTMLNMVKNRQVNERYSGLSVRLTASIGEE